MISLTRIGGLRPPRFHEVLDISDDGSFRMWRSVSMASDPPSPIGRFGGRLSADKRRQLDAASSGAANEGSRARPPSPDSPVDTLDVGGVSTSLGIYDSGEGAWATLIGLVRPLLSELAASPLAAIALQDAALVHQGTEPLRLDLSELAIRAVHWRKSDSQGMWTTDVQSQGEVTAKPGWRFALPLEHGFALEAGDRLELRVTFAAHDGEEMVPVSVQS